MQRKRRKRSEQMGRGRRRNSGHEIRVDYLARVEGESGLYVKLERGQVAEVQLNIVEPPRLFEAFLVGRSYEELPDLTARVCGICPVAYQMSSVHAAENAFGTHVTGQLRRLRRLLYLGEWIESHTLSIYLLAAPDFLGYESALAMASDHPDVVKRGLALKRIGNDIVSLLGGREIHPVSVKVGGFSRVPGNEELASLVSRLKVGKEHALRTLEWVASLPLPQLSLDRELVALSHPDEYAINEGRVVSNRGLDIAAREFEQHFIEEQVRYSNALHTSLKGRGAYLVGPLARVSLNFDRLSSDAQAAGHATGIAFPNDNSFTNIVARAIEVVHCTDEAMKIVAEYERPAPYVPVSPRAGTGFGLTEAPRGMLYHRYEFDERGLIKAARMIPPTAQNQRQIEEDLRAFVPSVIDLPLDEATQRCETVVRNYDPCNSCSTHFLRLHVKRS